MTLGSIQRSVGDLHKVEENRKPEGGWGWVVVISAMAMCSLLDGYIYSTNQFYEEFMMEYKKSASLTALPSSTMTAVLLFICMAASACRFPCFLIFHLVQLFSSFCKWSDQSVRYRSCVTFCNPSVRFGNHTLGVPGLIHLLAHSHYWCPRRYGKWHSLYLPGSCGHVLVPGENCPCYWYRRMWFRLWYGCLFPNHQSTHSRLRLAWCPNYTCRLYVSLHWLLCPSLLTDGQDLAYLEGDVQCTHLRYCSQGSHQF